MLSILNHHFFPRKSNVIFIFLLVSTPEKWDFIEENLVQILVIVGCCKIHVYIYDKNILSLKKKAHYLNFLKLNPQYSVKGLIKKKAIFIPVHYQD